MKENLINEINDNMKNFLQRESERKTKINQIEDGLQKMQTYFSRPNTPYTEEIDTKSSDFIRYGTNHLTTKELSSVDEEGGVLLDNKLCQKIISEINVNSPMRQIASIEKISTRSMDIIIEDGSFTSGWIGEKSARNATDTSKLLKKTIHTHELYAQPKATQSIIDDSEINVEYWLKERLVDSFTRLENKAFILGDGNNQPFGLLQNKDIKQIKIDEISAESLLKLITALNESYLPNAYFLMNRKTLATIQTLKDNNGRFIWQQSLSDRLKQTIFGIPTIVSSYMPDIKKDSLAIAIGNFQQGYKIIDRSEISVVRDPYTEKPFVKFYATKRVGGDVVNPESIKFAQFTK